MLRSYRRQLNLMSGGQQEDVQLMQCRHFRTCLLNIFDITFGKSTHVEVHRMMRPKCLRFELRA